MTILAIEHIVTSPNVNSGKPRIAETRMRVQDVVYYHHAGWSIDRIGAEFDLTLGQIHAALSYYFDHKDEIDADIREDDKFAREVSGKYQETKRRIQERKRDGGTKP
jgi:uncharacterized protein (DUF433 family)